MNKHSKTMIIVITFSKQKNQRPPLFKSELFNNQWENDHKKFMIIQYVNLHLIKFLEYVLYLW